MHKFCRFLFFTVRILKFRVMSQSMLVKNIATVIYETCMLQKFPQTIGIIFGGSLISLILHLVNPSKHILQPETL